MTTELANLSFAIGLGLIGFAFYIAFSYRSDQEDADPHSGHKWIIWRFLQICGVLIIVAQGMRQLLLWE